MQTASLEIVPHQLATLAPDRLGAFARSLLHIPAAPSQSHDSAVSSPAAAHLAALEEAVALSVDLKLVALSASSSWVLFRTSRKQQLVAWVRELLSALAVEGELASAGAQLDGDYAARIAALAGLYSGLKAANADSSLVRDVEIEAAVAIEVGLEAISRKRRKGKGKVQGEGEDITALALYAAASLLPRLPATSVRALSTKTLVELSVSSVGPLTAPEDLQRFAAIIVVSLHALSTDLLRSGHVRSACETLASHLDEFAPTVDQLNSRDESASHFLNFIVPVTSVLAEILVAYPLSSATIRRVSNRLLVVFWRWAPAIDRAGGFDALFEAGKTWWTLLDVLMSDVWSVDDRSTLLRELSGHAAESSREDEAYMARANATLIVAEQIIGGSSIESILPVLSADILPTCERYLDDNTRLDVFESAHSVVLAILGRPLRRSAKGRLSPAVKTFVSGLVDSYLATLLRNADCGQLSDDQLRHAARILIRRASDISPASASAVLEVVQAQIGRPQQEAALTQTYLGLYAAVMPAVPVSILPAYLESLEHLIRSGTAARSPERALLIALVWDDVSAGLGDESKLVGIDWWLACQARLEEKQSEPVKAKL